MLSSAHPTTPFEATQGALWCPTVGRRTPRLGFALGALDLIRKQHGTGLFENTGIEVHRGTGDAAGVSREGRGWSDTFLLEHESMDLVIMNPPFTRPTNHEATTVPVPSFAGLGNDAEEQAAMSRLLRDIRKDIKEPAGHGNAGLASNFLDLAHAKVKPGGVLALVMPLSLLQGGAWTASRADCCGRSTSRRPSLAWRLPAETRGSRSRPTPAWARCWSFRDAAGEARAAARKAADSPVTFVALRKRPASGAEAAALAVAIRDSAPNDASRVVLGGDLYGVLTHGTWDDGKCASIVHADVVETVQGLLAGELEVTADQRTHTLFSITALRELGARGLLDRDINGVEKSVNEGTSEDVGETNRGAR